MTGSDSRDLLNTAEELSARLMREVRTVLKMSQDKFGDLIGAHFVTVSRIENEKLPLPDGLRDKLLILQELTSIPGVPDTLRYIAHTRNGNDAMLVAQLVHKVVT